MRTVSVKSIYTVDTISKGNGKAWLKLMDWMKENLAENEEVEFDFKGIDVIQPWATNEFSMIMQDPRVHLKLWCSGETVSSINLMCMLNGIDGERATNVDIVPVKQPTKEELKIKAKAEELQPYFEEENGEVKLNIHKKFDQIGVPITVAYIEEAMRMYANKTGVKKLHLEARDIVIQPSVIKNVTDLITKLGNEGITLTINSNDTEVMNKVGMYRSLEGNTVISDKDKLRVIKASLRPGKVGMLIRYQESKARDEFGRSGKGKAISCRVALYMGLKREDGRIVLNFTTFNCRTFYTKVHWALEHDNNILDKLDVDNLSIPIDQFGMYDSFLGSKFHFITPVQMRPEDSMTMCGVDENGKITYTVMTIPERIKAVFDDWDIKYDRESIHTYIQKTREILG